MQYRSIKGYTGWAQLGFLFAFVAIGIVLLEIVRLFLGSMALGPNNLPLAERSIAMMEAIMQPKNIVYAQLLQTFGTFFLLFFPSLLFTIVCYRKLIWAGFSSRFSFLQIVLAFFILLAGNILAIPFEDISKAVLSNFPHLDFLAKQAESLYTEQVTTLSTLNTWAQFFLAVLIMAFLPALFEEFFFRGVIQNLLVRWLKKPVIAIIITSALFSLIHASYYLFISRFILGYTLGLLFYQSKNIWINILAHFFNNLIVVTQLFAINMSKPMKKPDLSEMNPEIPAWTLLISFAILIGLFIQFDKISKAKKEQIETDEALALADANI